MGQCQSCRRTPEDLVGGAFPPQKERAAAKPAADRTAREETDEDTSASRVEFMYKSPTSTTDSCTAATLDSSAWSPYDDLGAMTTTDITPTSSSSGSRNKRRHSNNKKGKQPFTPLMQVNESCQDDIIPEEQDPEAPSDEEDFHYDLKQKRRLHRHHQKHLPSPQSIQNPPPVDPPGKQAVHPDAYSHFQKLKLQVAVAQKQQKQQSRVERDEQKLHQHHEDRQLWKGFQQLQLQVHQHEESSSVSSLQHQQQQQQQQHQQHKRKDSFDLQDTDSWYINFQSQDAEESDMESDTGSQASLSLLSETSMEAQRRLYREKARQRGQKKSKKKSLKRGAAPRQQQQQQPPVADYGPQRGGETQLGLEVAFKNNLTRDDHSWVSDLGDDGSLSNSIGSYKNNRNNNKNDYGVLRRYRHRTVQEVTAAGNAHQQVDPRFKETLRALEAGKEPLAARLDRIEEALAATPHKKSSQQQQDVEPSPEATPVIKNTKASLDNSPGGSLLKGTMDINWAIASGDELTTDDSEDISLHFSNAGSSVYYSAEDATRGSTPVMTNVEEKKDDDFHRHNCSDVMEVEDEDDDDELSTGGKDQLRRDYEEMLASMEREQLRLMQEVDSDEEEEDDDAEDPIDSMKRWEETVEETLAEVSQLVDKSGESDDSDQLAAFNKVEVQSPPAVVAASSPPVETEKEKTTLNKSLELYSPSRLPLDVLHEIHSPDDEHSRGGATRESSGDLLRRMSLDQRKPAVSPPSSAQKKPNPVHSLVRPGNTALRARHLSYLLDKEDAPQRGPDDTPGAGPVYSPRNSSFEGSCQSASPDGAGVLGMSTEEFLNLSEENSFEAVSKSPPNMQSAASFDLSKATPLRGEAPITCQPDEGDSPLRYSSASARKRHILSLDELRGSPQSLDSARNSLLLADEVEAQVQDVLSKYREGETSAFP